VIMAKDRVETILRELDDASEDFSFPTLENGYIAVAASRLSAFGDKRRWAMIIEVVGWFHKAPGEEQFETAVHRLGGFYDTPTARDEAPPNTIERLHFVKGLDRALSRSEPSAAASIKVKLRNTFVHVPLAVEEYLRHEIVDFNEPIGPPDVLRWLTHHYRTYFLLTPSEIQARVPRGLSLILQLDEWNHPRIGRPPSGTGAFRSIARAIAALDPTKYQPKQRPNTHWRNWPMGGAL
jgi:hypothetical protein